ncbi:hypothetical protein ACIQ7Q_10150 [Streptomyces sp. NPDC096176]|uniref:hypothetical protein n=1 Tax=Streptomyces sp. NPDC096176 TaxID=3366079 RepID=UPI00382365A2
MTTDPNASFPSDYQGDRPRPPDRTSDAAHLAPPHATRAVPPIPPLPPHPPVFPPAPTVAAGSVGPRPPDPGHPVPGHPDPFHPAPVNPAPVNPDPFHPAPVHPAPVHPAPGTGHPDEGPRPVPDAFPPRDAEEAPRPSSAAIEQPSPLHAASFRPLNGTSEPPSPPNGTADGTRPVRDIAAEPTPVRDAVADPHPLRTTPVPPLSPLSDADEERPASDDRGDLDDLDSLLEDVDARNDVEPAPPAGPLQDGPVYDSEQPIQTLLWTAATERPIAEVAALVSRLKRTGEVDSPGDVALRAAAVSRPLEEVRELIALLKNEHPNDLHEAATTLRAAAVGRSIEDVVELVNMIGTDASEWQCPPNEAAAEGPEPLYEAAPARAPGATTEAAAAGAPAPAPASASPAAPAEQAKKPTPWPVVALNSALAAGPSSHTVSPAMGSQLRWPASLALFACGVIHLPTDVAGLRSGGYAETLSVAVMVLCLVVALWLAVRDTVLVWAAAAGLAVGIIALHALTGMGTLNLLQSSLGASFGWATVAAVLCAGTGAVIAGSVLLRRPQPTAGATPNS